MRGFQPAGGKPQQKTSSGPVRGPGTGTSDEVPDVVADGTYIMPTDSTQAIGEKNLAAMGKDGGVPVNLSNGEFKLPPDQVHAVGVQALDQMKNATHTPVAARGFATGSQQQAEPPLFFVNGGVVDEETRRRFAQVPASFGERGNNTFGAAAPAVATASTAAPVAPAAPMLASKVESPNQTSPTNIFPQSSQSAGANIYSAAGFSPDQFGSSGKFAQVPSSIGQQPGRQQPAAAVATPVPAALNGMTDAQRATAINQIPTGGVMAPPVPTPPAPAPAPAMSAQAQSDRAKIGAAWDTVKDVNNDAGRAIADVAMLAPRAVAGAYDSAVIRPMRAAGFNASYLSPSLVPNGVDPSSMTPYTDQKRMVQAAAPANQNATTAPAASTAVARTGPAPMAPQTIATPMEGGRGRINPPVTNPSAAAPTSSQPATTQLAPGVFRSRNSYGDSEAAALAGAQQRGLPSAQNMAAADALAQRSQQESMSRITAAQPVERGWSGQIGTDPAAGRERKELVASLTTPMKGAQNGQLTAAQRNGMLSLLDQEARGFQAKANNATALKQTEMQGMTQRDLAAMRESGDNGRAVLREAGETGRAGARNAIDQGRLGLEQQAKGFQIRFGEREEKLHQRYEAAKTTEEKAAIALQIRDLSGKAEPTNRFTVVPGGQEWDATAGAMRNVPGRVLNNQSGQFVEQGGAAPKSGPITPNSKAEYDALPKGAQYIKDGKILIKN